MKKLILTITILLQLSFVALSPVYAVYPVFDPKAFAQDIKNYARDGLILGKESISASTGAVTAAQQTLSTVNETVLIPARDTLTIIAMIKSGQVIQNLILGATGVDPLLVRNPQKYLKKQGQEVVRGVVEDPEVQKTLYETSVMKSVINEAKYEALGLQDKIKAINSSNLPIEEQRARCTDEALSSLAMKDTTRGGASDPLLYAARKQELFTRLCGDINDTNTKLALIAVAKAEPNWNTWLATTGGDNAWQKEVLTKEAIAKKQAEEIESRKKELETNGSIRSERKCIKRIGGGDDSSPCLEWEITKTADILNTAFKNSLTAPQQLQLAGFGKGAGGLVSSVTGLAGTAFTTLGLLNGISTGLGGDVLVGGGSNSSDSLPASFSNNAPVVTKSTPKNDLINNQATKSVITRAPKDQLDAHRNSLIELNSTDTKYQNATMLQKSNLSSMKSCYDSLISTYSSGSPNLPNDTRIRTAQNFYGQQLNDATSEYEAVGREKALAEKGVTFIETVVAKLDASQSSEEILDIFLDYQNQLKKENIPDISVALTRKGEYTSYLQKVQDSVKEGGEIFEYTATCAIIKNEEDVKRGLPSVIIENGQ